MSAYTEFKEMEGTRIQPLLAAVAALPAAALVLGEDASPGAPLFLLAMAFVALAYIMWMCSDSVFALRYEHDDDNFPAEGRRLEGVGYYMSWCTYLYGAGSILLSVLGFAGVHSTIRTPVDVNQGFIAAMVVTVLVAAHGAHAIHLRNTQEKRP